MPRRSRRRPGGTIAAPSANQPALPAERARRCLLGGVIAVLVARAYVPGTGVASEGHGASFAVLWPLLLCGWAIYLLLPNARRLLPQAADWAGLLLVAACLISGGLACTVASPRPALNMVGQVIAMAIGYWLVRQLVRSRQEMRATVAILLAVGFAMAVVGLYQYAVDLPEQQRQYETVKDDPQQLFAWSGQWLADDPAGRKRFEDRLYTREPYGTLALSNSLAGFLVPWLVMIPGMLCATWTTSSGRTWRARGGWIAMWIAMAGCLALTGSRSGFVAVIAGWFVLAAGMLLSPSVAGRKVRAAVAIGGLSLVGLIAVAAAMRDSQFVDLASRSLGYRWEYWQSTWQMIGDYPLLGCGPGQFQDTYPAYKLPAASEEVADPHNFLLEVWATAGPFAVVGLVGLFALALWGSWRGSVDGVEESLQKPAEGAPAGAIAAVYLGAGAGLLLGPATALIAHLPLSMPHAVMLATGVSMAVAVLHPWVVSGRLPRGILAAAVIAMLVHLTASGGITDPTMAGVLWTLLAILVTSREGVAGTTVFGRAVRRGIAMAWLVTSGVIVAGAWATVYRPVIAARGYLATAASPAVLSRPPAYVAALRQAVAADPWSARVARLLARAQLEDALAARDRTDATIDRWIALNDRTLDLAPRSAQLYSESSQGYRDLHERFAPLATADGSGEEDSVGLLKRAVLDARRAVERYPTRASYRLQLAELLATQGGVAAAAQQYAAALAMDDAKRQAGHLDKLLPTESRERVEQRLRELAADTSASPASPSPGVTPRDAN